MKTILYDGECGFCSATVRFVWKRDPNGIFHFAAIQSKAGSDLLIKHGIDKPLLDTFYFIDEGRIFERSDVGLGVWHYLANWKIFSSLCRWIPIFIRNAVYDFIARNRMRISKHVACELPPPEVRKRFLDQADTTLDG